MSEIKTETINKIELIKKDFKNLCRLCLGTQKLIQIYKDLAGKNKQFSYNEDVQIYFQMNYVQVSCEDGLPNYVCEKCVEIMKIWHDFKEICSRSYQKLLAIKNECEEEEVEDYDYRNTGDFLEYEQTETETQPIEKVEIKMDQELDEKPIKRRRKKTKKYKEMSDTESEEEKPKTKKGKSKKKTEIESESSDEYDPKTKEDGTSKEKKKYSYVKQCPFCGVVLKTSMKAHILIHTTPGGRPFKCDQCDKTYKRRERLRLHVSRDHLMVRHECDVCHKFFSTKNNLNIHKKLHNSSGNDFKCDVCEKTFTSYKYLYKHKQTHNGIKNFVCSYCGKAFLYGEYLKDHVRIHTGERPYLCKTCGKDFRTAHHLRQHGRVHTGIQPYKCLICGINFGTRKALDTHKSSQHQEDNNAETLSTVTTLCTGQVSSFTQATTVQYLPK